MLTLAAGILATFLIGCESEKPILIDQVRKNPTPEMETIARTHDQRKNDHAIVKDYNERQIGDDIDAILLMDRPVRLSPYVLPQ
jgi:hypothetical protein